MRNLGYLEKRLTYLGESGLVDRECALCTMLLDTMLLIRNLNLPRITTPLNEFTLMDVETI